MSCHHACLLLDAEELTTMHPAWCPSAWFDRMGIVEKIMHVGVFIFASDHTASIADVAREVEARGLDLLMLPEHTHVPVSRTTLSPAGGVLQDEHRRTFDPFVGLAVAAAVTSRLLIGTGVCLVAQRDPVTMAKEVASIDVISGGRFVFGVGHGWHVDEVGNHGIAVAERRAVAREKVMAMKAIWSQDVAQWDGTYVHFSPLFSWPKPVQQPHPPILLGGSPNGAVLNDVVAYADGWLPYAPFHDVAGGIARLRRLAETVGRDPADIELAVMGCPPDPREVGRFHDLGARRVVFDLAAADWDTVRRRLDRSASIFETAKQLEVAR
jgi:probable F420-dependent oxidoreductase